MSETEVSNALHRVADEIASAVHESFHGDGSERGLIEAAGQNAEYLRCLANAITPIAAVPSMDATYSHVGSLTEAVMGMTAALVQIASSIESVANAVGQGQAQVSVIREKTERSCESEQ